MISFEERLLETVLPQAVAGRAPPELAERIFEAVRRTRTRTRRRRALAAALLVAGACVAAWFTTHERPVEASADELLAQAESGQANAVAKLRARLDSAPAPERRRIALFLAQRSEAVGESVLRRAADTEPDLALRIGCAAALYRLGDPGPWQTTVDKAQASIEVHLAAGRLDPAHRLVAALEHFLPSQPATSIQVSYLAERLARRMAAAGPTTAETLRKRLLVVGRR